MTNYEKFKDRLNKFGACGIKWGVTKGEPVWCDYNLECNKCELHSEDSCCEKRLEWLDSEYKEPEVDWREIPIDTKILVSDNGKDWHRRYFAGIDPNTELASAWECGCTSWSSENGEASIDSTVWRFAKLAEEEDQ